MADSSKVELEREYLINQEVSVLHSNVLEYTTEESLA